MWKFPDFKTVRLFSYQKKRDGCLIKITTLLNGKLFKLLNYDERVGGCLIIYKLNKYYNIFLRSSKPPSPRPPNSTSTDYQSSSETSRSLNSATTTRATTRARTAPRTTENRRRPWDRRLQLMYMKSRAPYDSDLTKRPILSLSSKLTIRRKSHLRKLFLFIYQLLSSSWLFLNEALLKIFSTFLRSLGHTK